jgi:hypothetical protein
MTNPTHPNSPSQWLLYPQDQPTPQDYADALAQLGKQAPTNIRTPGALASNLMADALLQYGQGRAQRAQGASAGNGPPDGAFASTVTPRRLGLAPLSFPPGPYNPGDGS